MDIQFSDKTPVERYHLLVQSVIPRPIAWILTAEEDGGLNLAPYSFFRACMLGATDSCRLHWSEVRRD